MVAPVHEPIAAPPDDHSQRHYSIHSHSKGLWYIQTWENQADCAHIVVDLPPNAIGAKVEITSELGTSTRWVSPASVWSSSSSQIFSGSLGMALVTVTWPDGTQWQQNDVAPGTRLEPTW